MELGDRWISLVSVKNQLSLLHLSKRYSSKASELILVGICLCQTSSYVNRHFPGIALVYREHALHHAASNQFHCASEIYKSVTSCIFKRIVGCCQHYRHRHMAQIHSKKCRSIGQSIGSMGNDHPLIILIGNFLHTTAEPA